MKKQAAKSKAIPATRLVATADAPVESPKAKGRPTKVDSLKATIVLKVYLTPTEAQRVNSLYQQQTTGKRTTKSEFAKNRIFTPLLPQGRPTHASSKPDRGLLKLMSQIQLNKLDSLLTQLRPIGINLNQSTRRLHQYHLQAHVEKEAKLHGRLLEQIAELIGRIEVLYDEVENTFNHVNNSTL